MNRAKGIGPVGADLVADAVQERGVLADVAEVGRRRRGAALAGCRPSRPSRPAFRPEREPQARTDQRVPTEQDRDRCVRGRARQRSQPRVGDALVEQEVGGVAVLGGRPARARRRPRRWASSTRLSMMAASPRRARCSPSDDGPSRSSRAPSTLAAGRWPGWLVRMPRSSMMARVRAAPDRSSHASAAGRGPAGDDDLGGAVGDDAPDRDEPRLDALAVGGGRARRTIDHRGARGRAGRRCRRPSRHRRRRSATGTPATSSSQRGSMLSLGRSGRPARASRARAIATMSAE